MAVQSCNSRSKATWFEKTVRSWEQMAVSPMVAVTTAVTVLFFGCADVIGRGQMPSDKTIGGGDDAFNTRGVPRVMKRCSNEPHTI